MSSNVQKSYKSLTMCYVTSTIPVRPQRTRRQRQRICRSHKPLGCVWAGKADRLSGTNWKRECLKQDARWGPTLKVHAHPHLHAGRCNTHVLPMHNCWKNCSTTWRKFIKLHKLTKVICIRLAHRWQNEPLLVKETLPEKGLLEFLSLISLFSLKATH